MDEFVTSFCKKYVTKPLFSASVNNVDFLCQARCILADSTIVAALSSIQLFLDSRLVASEYIPKDLPQVQTFRVGGRGTMHFFYNVRDLL